MSIVRRITGYGLVAALVALAGWIGIRSISTETAVEAPVIAPTAAGPTPQASAQGTPVATVSTGTSATDMLPLKQQAMRIVETYYHIDVYDTSETRHAAVAKLVPMEIVDDPGFGVGNTSCWDQARLTNQLKERASVSIDAITTEQVQTDRKIIHMQVPGKVQQYLPDGKPFAGTDCFPGGYEFVATFDWELGDKGWTLVNFGNPGDIS